MPSKAETKPKMPPGPHVPHKWEKADVRAIKQLAEGKAGPVQQKRALDWIIKAAGTYDLSYRPNDTVATAFAEGKRFVGTPIVKKLKINLSVIPDKETRK